MHSLDPAAEQVVAALSLRVRNLHARSSAAQLHQGRGRDFVMALPACHERAHTGRPQLGAQAPQRPRSCRRGLRPGEVQRGAARHVSGVSHSRKGEAAVLLHVPAHLACMAPRPHSCFR